MTGTGTQTQTRTTGVTTIALLVLRTGELKIAKIVLIRNPRWPPWKSIFCSFFSWTKRPTDSKLGMKHRVTGRSKIAKIVLIISKMATSFSYFWCKRHPDASYQVSSPLAQGCRRSRLLKQLLMLHERRRTTSDIDWSQQLTLSTSCSGELKIQQSSLHSSRLEG